jgi:hypothetical protein
MVECPRYYPYKKKVQINYKQWLQQSFPFMKTIKMVTSKRSLAKFEKQILATVSNTRPRKYKVHKP